MSSTGLNRDAGTLLSGFEHVEQSIRVILTTPIGSRVMRRDFGSELLDLIDRPMTDQVILAVYAATVMALARWEPRFSVQHCALTQAGADGVAQLELRGVHFPRGHLGDFSAGRDAEARVIIPRRLR